MTASRLRPSIHVAPVDSGVAFLGLDDSFVLSGSADSIWTVWRAVAPMLEHGVDLTGLVDAAPSPSVRRLLETLIDQLTAHDMLIAHSDPGLKAHPDAARFADVIGFLEAVAPDPAGSFEALRAATVTVRGPADLVFATARTLARSAVGRIDAIVTGGEPLDLSRLGDYVSLDGIDIATEPRGVPDVLITVPAAEAAQAAEAAADLDGDDPPRRFEVLVTPDFAAIAAVSRRELPSGVEPAWASRLTTGERDEPVSPVLITLAASTAAHQAVLWIAGLPAEVDGRQVLGIDAADLATTTHQVSLPAAPWPGAAGGESRYVLPEAEPAATKATPDELLKAAGALADERFGLVRPPHPLAFVQVPLALAGCGERGPGVLGPGVLGIAETGEYARLDALLAAVRALPGALPDRSAKARCVRTGQLVAADADLRWVVAAGYDLRQLLADALARLLVGLAAGTARFEPVDLRPAADPEAWRWLKTMTVRWGHELTVRRWHPPELPGWVVIGAQADSAAAGGQLAGWAAGPDEADCVRTALIRVCGAAQATRDPAAPPLPDPVAAAGVTGPEINAAIAGLAATGHHLVHVPWTAEPAVTEAGILICHAGISHD